MSIGQGNITVQSKKEAGEATQANNGLTLTGNLVQLGGGLTQETHIGLTTAGTFSIDGGGVGGQSVLYFDEFNTQYFYGIVGSGPVFITGMEVTAVGQLFLYAAQKKAFSAVQGFADLVVTVGDVDNVGNGTKITVDDDAQTVEITNVPAGNTTNDFATFDGDQIKKIPAPVESGTYTPTILSNSGNVTAIATSGPFQYLRVGNTVTVSGAINITTNANGTVNFAITPPISSDFTDQYTCAGVMGIQGLNYTSAYIYGNDVDELIGEAVTTSNGGATFHMHFTYLITGAP